jgi:hypothetical protein
MMGDCASLLRQILEALRGDKGNGNIEDINQKILDELKKLNKSVGG